MNRVRGRGKEGFRWIIAPPAPDLLIECGRISCRCAPVAARDVRRAAAGVKKYSIGYCEKATWLERIGLAGLLFPR